MTISASAPSRRRLHKALFATIAACTGVVGLASAAQAASGPPSAARVNTRNTGAMAIRRQRMVGRNVGRQPRGQARQGHGVSDQPVR